MADKLVEIERRDWPALRDLYSPNSPATFIAHSAVDTYIRWTNQQPDLPNLAIYSLNGDWSDGSFAAVFSDLVHTYTLTTSNERLSKLLQLLDFSKGLKILTVMSKDRSTVLDVIKSKNLKLKFDNVNLLHHLPATEALKFDTTPPEGITLKPVELTDVHIVDEVWPHRDEGTFQLLYLLAQFNPSVGAYNSDRRLMAWVLRLSAGPLGALQVDAEFYGRGLGMVVTKALSRKIAEWGQDIGACVFEENVHSLNIFKKLGFSIVDEISWIATQPIE